MWETGGGLCLNQAPAVVKAAGQIWVYHFLGIDVRFPILKEKKFPIPTKKKKILKMTLLLVGKANNRLHCAPSSLKAVSSPVQCRFLVQRGLDGLALETYRVDGFVGNKQS